MLKGLLCLPFLAGLVAAPAAADEQLPELRSQVIAGRDANAEYSASVERLQDRRPIRSEALPADDVWRFRDVPYGEYRLTIRSSDGTPVYEQWITVNSQTSTVMINLPVRVTSVPVSGTVSVGQLLHPINKRAWKFFKSSQTFIEKGDFERAAGQLERAVETSPGYADAYGSLAAVHIKKGPLCASVVRNLSGNERGRPKRQRPLEPGARLLQSRRLLCVYEGLPLGPCA